jgi:hypothetical protein
MIDDIDLALRKWTAQQGLLQLGREVVQEHDLDPALVEAYEAAYLSQDCEAAAEAVVNLLDAAEEAGALDQAN